MDILVKETENTTTKNWSFVKKVQGPYYAGFLQKIDQYLGPYNQVRINLEWKLQFPSLPHSLERRSGSYCAWPRAEAHWEGERVGGACQAGRDRRRTASRDGAPRDSRRPGQREARRGCVAQETRERASTGRCRGQGEGRSAAQWASRTRDERTEGEQGRLSGWIDWVILKGS